MPFALRSVLVCTLGAIGPIGFRPVLPGLPQSDLSSTVIVNR